MAERFGDGVRPGRFVRVEEHRDGAEIWLDRFVLRIQVYEQLEVLSPGRASSTSVRQLSISSSDEPNSM
jgi:hypothetical protein